MSDNSNKAETSKSMDSFRIKENWTVVQVCGLLKRAGLTTFKVARSILFGDPKERLEILKVIKNQPKVFNDPIHGSIELHPLLVRIIDTPQFQRLRNIKQLGGAYFVYPGACHSRFEHCIGVAHLAGQLGQTLKKKQNNIISDEDILCVQIAGLCHDLGHGPFSHLFDGIFLKGEIKHEDISVKMFDDLVTKNGLNPLMKLYGVDHRLEDIKKMIHPKANPELVIPDEKSFLYEIVSNKTNGVDVDKFDYFARDCHYLGLQNNFDHQRFMMFARVCKDNDGKTHICMRDKEADSLYTMFQTRYYLHKNACQHRVKYGIDLMINDALEAAKDKQIEGLDKTLDEITQDIENTEMDLTSFTQLTDRVFEQILHSDNTELEKAKKILERIKSRNLYKCVFEKPVGRKRKQKNVRQKLTSKFKQVTQENIDQLKTKLIELTKNQPEDKRLTRENFEVAYVTMDYGMGEKDPVKSMYFYTKSDPDTATKMDKKRVSQLIPNRFSETVLRVYKKSGRMDPKDLEEVFEQ